MVRIGASGGKLATRSPISNSILFTLLMQLHQMQPSLRSRYDRHSRGWNSFCQHPLSTFPPLLPPPGHAPPPPQTSLVGLPLWIEERGLTKVSMVTVHSVNHAAADVSSPSLFPFFSLLCCHPPACTQPLPSFLLPSCALSCTFPSSHPHFPLQFEKKKAFFPWSTLSPLPHFLLPPPNRNHLLLLF